MSIKIENVKTYGWEAAIRGMRNPYNSWDRSDSRYDISVFGDPETDGFIETIDADIGENDMVLMKKLISGGPVHSKFLRMITVTADITAPLYWWKEFDTYKVGTVANSCSTMHTITNKEFTIDDFSHEHLESVLDFINNGISAPIIDLTPDRSGDILYGPAGVLDIIIRILNKSRELYLETKDKRYWWQIIQLLPSSYNQRRTVQINYEVLRNIVKWRSDHKLDEWKELCRYFVEELPYGQELLR